MIGNDLHHPKKCCSRRPKAKPKKIPLWRLAIFPMSLRQYIPSPIKNIYARLKKLRRRQQLYAQKEREGGVAKSELVAQLRQVGIVPGDVLLIHTSMSKMGYLENGPQTAIDALLETLGPEGTLVMPSSPVAALQVDYMAQAPVFDVKSTPSKMGAITEVFRKMPGTQRSLHPTEPVCAHGPQAKFITEGHFGRLTPYDEFSPWQRLAQLNGKIIYAGVTLINAGTSLHTLEDSVEFEYPVYTEKIYTVSVIDLKGEEHQVKTRAHNPVWSAKRRCDELIPWFESEGVLTKFSLGKADSLLLHAQPMLDTMIEGYRQKKITMYHPHGSAETK